MVAKNIIRKLITSIFIFVQISACNHQKDKSETNITPPGVYFVGKTKYSTILKFALNGDKSKSESSKIVYLTINHGKSYEKVWNSVLEKSLSQNKQKEPVYVIKSIDESAKLYKVQVKGEEHFGYYWFYELDNGKIDIRKLIALCSLLFDSTQRQQCTHNEMILNRYKLEVDFDMTYIAEWPEVFDLSANYAEKYITDNKL